ncbi:DNA (cytosine-5-)-methyltransferase [Maribacter sp. 2307ULW6-5]|uniref:DNA (cytosine-5-)-methyltransferase n=1 Tax=Maribacter sp. 2307ULW6-5 TaxID=3386275 RepID=UPI0039BC3C49
MKKVTVIELFAGVGGFRLGLEAGQDYEVVWSNQWEPSTKKQHASLVYEARFGTKNHSNADISEVPTADIPDADMLVGGFPCQDYSVASTLQNAKGLIGKKGVLWWSIHRILSEKKHPPKYLFLENVDRLLKSPSGQRGRDFAIMLKSLEGLGYAVEWRVINAADYGMPQRRRRIFFIGYHKSTPAHAALLKTGGKDWLHTTGVFARAFPVLEISTKTKAFSIAQDLVGLSENFNLGQQASPFENSGVFVGGHVHTEKTQADHQGERTVLGDILETGNVPEAFFVSPDDYPKWDYLKGAKKEVRTAKNGFEYHYTEGAMVFPDALDKPSRTIITGEGGKSPSRFKHVVAHKKRLRRLTPVELERLNMFPDNHTQLQGISNAKRAFFMGNALVVGVVARTAKALYDLMQRYS